MSVLEKKAKAFDNLLIVIMNAICYMYEQGLTDNEISDYLGIDMTKLSAINNEDISGIV